MNIHEMTIEAIANMDIKHAAHELGRRKYASEFDNHHITEFHAGVLDVVSVPVFVVTELSNKLEGDELWGYVEDVLNTSNRPAAEDNPLKDVLKLRDGIILSTCSNHSILPHKLNSSTYPVLLTNDLLVKLLGTHYLTGDGTWKQLTLIDTDLVGEVVNLNITKTPPLLQYPTYLDSDKQAYPVILNHAVQPADKVNLHANILCVLVLTKALAETPNLSMLWKTASMLPHELQTILIDGYYGLWLEVERITNNITFDFRHDLEFNPVHHQELIDLFKYYLSDDEVKRLTYDSETNNGLPELVNQYTLATKSGSPITIMESTGPWFDRMTAAGIEKFNLMPQDYELEEWPETIDTKISDMRTNLKLDDPHQ